MPVFKILSITSVLLVTILSPGAIAHHICFVNTTGSQCEVHQEDIQPDRKASENPNMEGREGVPPSAATGSRAIDSAKRWCKWGEDPKTAGCDNLGSGVGG